MLIRLIRPMLLSPFVSQRLTRFLSRPNQADLALLSRLVEEGAVRPLVDRSFPLLQTAAALRHIETGHARGQVVIAVTTMTA
jgi:NADPH:quinone reductase-like Zn-dependent oxidoreductase